MSLRMTDPMARKNENVAALLSMYWERVARNPRGPGPALRILYDPKMNPIVSPTPPPISAPIFNFCQTEGPCCCGVGYAMLVAQNEN